MKRLMTHPGILIGSDGIPLNPHLHPRLWGAFPRVLGHYARDLGLMEMEDAIHRMTGASADRFGLRDRGRVEAGAYADLVVFDRATIIDTGRFMEPEQPAVGHVRARVEASGSGRGFCERLGYTVDEPFDLKSRGGLLLSAYRMSKPL